MMDTAFVHLRTRSAYSLSEGAIELKPLVKLAAAAEMPALAVTDNANLFGALEFALAAAAAGVQPLVGTLLPMVGEDGGKAKVCHLPVLVQTDEGYENLLYLVSKAFLESGDEGEPRLAQRHNMPEERASEPVFLDWAYARDLPLVATNDVYFAERKLYEAHDVLLCIAAGKRLDEIDRRRVTPEHYFKSAAEMVELFADLPEAIANTLVVAERCAAMPSPRKPILPAFGSEGGRDETDELRAQAEEGLDQRLATHVFPSDASDPQRQELAQPYRERLAHELKIINDMGFPGYFLIVSEFIKWAKERDIPVGPGRGSGAGSLVAYSLQITDLDPLRWGLLFERFLNPERVSMPDFDVDFCQDRRDEVIEHVRRKYGEDRVAQIITFGKLQARAALRDVGRVLGMPYGRVDKICKLVPKRRVS